MASHERGRGRIHPSTVPSQNYVAETTHADGSNFGNTRFIHSSSTARPYRRPESDPRRIGDGPSSSAARYTPHPTPAAAFPLPTTASPAHAQAVKPASPRQPASPPTAVGPGEWSAKVWQGIGFSSNKAYVSNPAKPGVDHTSTITVGLGRATGLSRVPDQSLAQNPALIEHRLADLRNRVDRLEQFDCSVVSAKPEVSVDATLSGETAAIFEAILADFRELTMAVTASPLPEVKRLSIDVYEAAADAALLGGNLDFYLVCQTRLLRDLYEEHASDPMAISRRDEFFAYSLLYFGVFTYDGIELARKFRRMDKKTLSSPYVRYAFSAINAIRNHDTVRFISLYKTGNVRQRTILHPALKVVQALGLKTLIKSYLQINRSYALSVLGMTSEEEFRRLLEAQRPDLVPLNEDYSSDFFFRLPRSAK